MAAPEIAIASATLSEQPSLKSDVRTNFWSLLPTNRGESRNGSNWPSSCSASFHEFGGREAVLNNRYGSPWSCVVTEASGAALDRRGRSEGAFTLRNALSSRSR